MGVNMLIGGPFTVVSTRESTEDEVWSVLQAYDTANDIMTAGSNSGPEEYSERNIKQSSVYSVLGVNTLSDGTKLVRMRSPAGYNRDYYNGFWSDYSKMWTWEFMQEVGFYDKSDGVFFMSLKDFILEFSTLFLTKDPSNLESSGFLMLDDSTPDAGVKGLARSAVHEFTLTSDVDQEFDLNFLPWDMRSVTRPCRQEDTRVHKIEVDGVEMPRIDG